MTRRPVKQGDLCTGRGEDRGLLSATSRQAQDPESRERREPLARDCPLLAQMDGPGSSPRINNLLTRYHLGVGILTGLDRLVPGGAVQTLDVHACILSPELHMCDAKGQG